MKLLPRNPKQMFEAVQALIAPGQCAFLVGFPEKDAIRICTPVSIYSCGEELTSYQQLERKEYKILA